MKQTRVRKLMKRNWKESLVKTPDYLKDLKEALRCLAEINDVG